MTLALALTLALAAPDVPAPEPDAAAAPDVPVPVPVPVPDSDSNAPAPTTPPADDRGVVDAKSPLLAAGLATFLPGGGQAYLGNWGDAAADGAFVAGTGILSVGFALDGWPGAGKNDPFLNFSSLYFSAGWGYGVFDSWRDARLTQGADDVPTEDVFQLASAPYDPETMTDWKTWAGLGGALALGLAGGAAADAFSGGHLKLDLGIARAQSVDFLGARVPPLSGFVLGNAFDLALFPAVAVGEESYFRGLIQTVLTEWVGPWPAWVIASLVFGLAHASNIFGLPANQRLAYLAVGVPTITLDGAILGLAYMDGHNLKRAVAIHYWYDALISGISFAVTPDGSYLFTTGAAF